MWAITHATYSYNFKKPQKGNVEEELHVKWKYYLKASLQRDYILFYEL